MFVGGEDDGVHGAGAQQAQVGPGKLLNILKFFYFQQEALMKYSQPSEGISFAFKKSLGFLWQNYFSPNCLTCPPRGQQRVFFRFFH